MQCVVFCADHIKRLSCRRCSQRSSQMLQTDSWSSLAPSYMIMQATKIWTISICTIWYLLMGSGSDFTPWPLCQLIPSGLWMQQSTYLSPTPTKSDMSITTIEAELWPTSKHHMRPEPIVPVLVPECWHVVVVAMIRSQSVTSVSYGWYSAATKHHWTVHVSSDMTCALLVHSLTAEKNLCPSWYGERHGLLLVWSSSICAQLALGYVSWSHTHSAQGLRTEQWVPELQTGWVEVWFTSRDKGWPRQVFQVLSVELYWNTQISTNC